MKKFYSEYVGHCARFYFSKADTPSVNDRVNYNNFISVSNVLSKYDTEKQNLLRFIYTSPSVIHAVHEYSASKGVTNEEVWYAISAFERDVAQERGLL